jgi:hypothetical protein
MPNTKQPFVYTLKHKMLGDQSTVTTITNNGVSRITANTTYTLAAPEVGCVKTIYRSASATTANTLIAASSGVSFDSNGGTQVLSLQPTTVGGGPDISVTLIGESSTQWRILSAYPALSTSSTSFGVRVTT